MKGLCNVTISSVNNSSENPRDKNTRGSRWKVKTGKTGHWQKGLATHNVIHPSPNNVTIQ